MIRIETGDCRDVLKTLPDLYRAFARHPKAGANPNYAAKIRQVLQQGPYRRVARGVWALKEKAA